MAVGPLAAPLPFQSVEEEKNRNRYFGPFLGFVRDVDDPEQKGRVRIHLPQLLGPEDVQDHWTDWAIPSQKGLSVPPVGATIIVEFEMGYVTHPIYRSGWLADTTSGTSSAPVAGTGGLDPNWTTEKTLTSAGGGSVDIKATIPADTAREKRPVYPNNQVYVSPAGHQFEVDDSPGSPRLRYYHPTGLNVLADTDGSVHFRGGGAYYFEPKGDYVVALQPGSTFKVIYPNGTAMSLSAQGFHVRGHQASLLGRAVVRRETDI